MDPATSLRPAVQLKSVAKGISRANIKRFTHEDYVEMFCGGNLQPVVNRRIQSKLHQVYSLEQTKRGLCPYDDKRYLLADFPDSRPNPNTHAYGHRDIANEAQLEKDVSWRPGIYIIIMRRENRFQN